MKIILAPAGTDGDVRPLLALGTVLRDKGHVVELCGSPNNVDWADRYGFTFHPLGRNLKAWMKDNSKAIVNQSPSSLKLFISYLREETPVHLCELTELAKGADYIVGSGLQVAGPSVAEAVGAAYFQVICCPQIFISADHPPVTVKQQNFPRWLNRICWGGMRIIINRTLHSVLKNGRNSLGLDPVDSVINYMNSSKFILIADEELAPVPPDVKKLYDYVLTGYWRLVEDEELDADLEEFLGAGPPPVYKGFGNMTDPYSQKTDKIIEDFMLASRQRTVISCGWADLGHDQSNTERKKIIESAPHDKLFPETAVAVHHGGAGTTYNAARAGIPQVIIPHVLDQFYWGRRIYDLKLGPRPVPRSKLTGDLLTAAVNEALSNPDFKDNARMMGEKLRRREGVTEALTYFS